MGAKGAVEIIFRGKDVEQKTLEYTERHVTWGLYHLSIVRDHELSARFSIQRCIVASLRSSDSVYFRAY